MKYYMDKYGVKEDWITNSSIEINRENLEILLNSKIYCLAWSLLFD